MMQSLPTLFQPSYLSQHDGITANKVIEFEAGLFDYLDANNAAELKAIRDEGIISDDVGAKLDKAMTAFQGGFAA